MKQNILCQLGRTGRVLSLAALFAAGSACTTLGNAEYEDFYNPAKHAKPIGIDFVQAISVTSPGYCTEVKGDVTVTFKAPGMTRVEAFCWQQPTFADGNPWGHDVNLAPNLKLDAEGNGSFVFHADQFPNGPTIIRIRAKDEGKKQDICELQLFNKGGVVWKAGIPKTDPAPAKGMKLAFSDDFSGPLSISGDGKGATYCAHKPGGGDFSGWLFTSPEGPDNPFSQVGTYLRIHASKKPGTKGSTGILAPVRQDATGFYSTVPFYMECRLIAQSAPGTWPAFWTLSKGPRGLQKDSPEYKEIDAKGEDEFDIIEAYGGYGNKNPNFPGYATTSHFWKQPKPDWMLEMDDNGKPRYNGHANVPIMEIAGKSGWSTTFHTYGLYVGEKETTYYFDDVKVLSHPTGKLTLEQPTFFMINYAIGGISRWQIDLERYGNQSDMWVDYVRVYQGAKK